MANQATSVVDFLKGRGFKPELGEKFPLYGTRKKVYETLGLNSTLGNFRGSADQNTALLRGLSKREAEAGVSLTPENIFTAINVAQGQQPQTVSAPNVTEGGVRLVPNPVQSRIDQIFNPLKGRDLAQEAIDKFTGSATFPLEQESVAADKQAIQLKAQADTESFIRNIASRGLIFSGKKQTGVNAIEAEKLSKMLGVDRSFAMLIAKGLESSAQDIAKEAQKGSQDALGALEKLGYTVNPLTGRIEETLTAKNARATEERFEKTQERLEKSSADTERRFQQSQDRLETNAEATQRRFEESQAATERRFQQTQARIASQVASAVKNLKANTALAVPVTGIAGPGVPSMAYFYVNEKKQKVPISKSQYEDLKKTSTNSALESILSAIQ